MEAQLADPQARGSSVRVPGAARTLSGRRASAAGGSLCFLDVRGQKLPDGGRKQHVRERVDERHLPGLMARHQLAKSVEALLRVPARRDGLAEDLEPAHQLHVFLKQDIDGGTGLVTRNQEEVWKELLFLEPKVVPERSGEMTEGLRDFVPRRFAGDSPVQNAKGSIQAFMSPVQPVRKGTLVRVSRVDVLSYPRLPLHAVTVVRGGRRKK